MVRHIGRGETKQSHAVNFYDLLPGRGVLFRAVVCGDLGDPLVAVHPELLQKGKLFLVEQKRPDCI